MVLHLVTSKNTPSGLSPAASVAVCHKALLRKCENRVWGYLFARRYPAAAIARTTMSTMSNVAIQGDSRDFMRNDGPTFFMKDITLLRNILTAPFRSRLLSMEEMQGAPSPDHASRRFLLTGVNCRHKVPRQSVPRIRDRWFRLTMLPRCPWSRGILTGESHAARSRAKTSSSEALGATLKSKANVQSCGVKGAWRTKPSQIRKIPDFMRVCVSLKRIWSSGSLTDPRKRTWRSAASCQGISGLLRARLEDAFQNFPRRVSLCSRRAGLLFRPNVISLESFQRGQIFARTN